MINRRTLLVGAAGGCLVGMTGVALTRNEPSIRFIGRRESIIALLDTSTERVLFILGDHDDVLLQNIPGLMIKGNTRVDLVIASHKILAAPSARAHLGIDSVKTIAIQGSDDMLPIRGNIIKVSRSLPITLGDSTTMYIDVALSDAADSVFLVSIEVQGANLVLASSKQALKMHKNRNVDLLAVPGPSRDLISWGLTPQILLTNTADSSLDVRQVEVFAEDPAIIRINRGSISVRADQFSS